MTISPAGAIKSLQKKRAQRDDVIKRAPVKPQMLESHVQNMMEIWHFCTPTGAASFSQSFLRSLSVDVTIAQFYLFSDRGTLMTFMVDFYILSHASASQK